MKDFFLIKSSSKIPDMDRGGGGGAPLNTLFSLLNMCFVCAIAPPIPTSSSCFSQKKRLSRIGENR